MKRSLVLRASILCLYALLTGQTILYKHNEKITEKYDRFTDKTFVILWKMSLAPGAVNSPPRSSFDINAVRLSLIADFPGKTISDPKNILAVFTYKGPRGPLITPPGLNLLIDGRRAALPTKWAEPSDLTEEGTTDIQATIPFELLRRIMTAKTVEIQLGIREFHLAGSNFAALRDFESRLTALTNL
jgi:hypothetical protein